MRGALADAETGSLIYLFKNVSELRLTYQIRLLAFRAKNENKKLIIRIPKECRIHSLLSEFSKSLGRVMRIERG